jgi:hypothetical protein
VYLDPGLDHRGGVAGSRGDPGRDRPGHEAVPHRRAPGLVGGSLPRAAGVGRAARIGHTA